MIVISKANKELRMSKGDVGVCFNLQLLLRVQAEKIKRKTEIQDPQRVWRVVESSGAFRFGALSLGSHMQVCCNKFEANIRFVLATEESAMEHGLPPNPLHSPSLCIRRLLLIKTTHFDKQPGGPPKCSCFCRLAVAVAVAVANDFARNFQGMA